MIPIRTDTPVRQTPLANYALIAANMLVFFMMDILAPAQFQSFKLNVLVLKGALPEWWQFFTYQFLHDGSNIFHLAGNMLFLWVFGNSVNAKMGNIPYLLFYLAGGVFAGWGFCLANDAPLMGASGSIAAITTAFLVLFPRSRIVFLFIFFIITTFELPSLWVILFKIVLWDNVLAPALHRGAGQVAYAAHLWGYAYGFVASLAMLLIRALPRDQFDLLGLVKRWNQRREFASGMKDPGAQARAKHGTVARAIQTDPKKQSEEQARLDHVMELRSNIQQALADKARHQEAADYYEQLMLRDPEQYLSRANQLVIARLFYAQHKFPQAAHAFETYLRHYPQADESEDVHLLLGIIYARDLKQYQAAEEHLNKVEESLKDQGRREQCRQWLEVVAEALKPATPSD